MVKTFCLFSNLRKYSSSLEHGTKPENFFWGLKVLKNAQKSLRLTQKVAQRILSEHGSEMWLRTLQTFHAKIVSETIF